MSALPEALASALGLWAPAAQEAARCLRSIFFSDTPTIAVRMLSLLDELRRCVRGARRRSPHGDALHGPTLAQLTQHLSPCSQIRHLHCRTSTPENPAHIVGGLAGLPDDFCSRLLPSTVTAVGGSAPGSAFWKYGYKPIFDALVIAWECLARQPDGSPALAPAIVAALTRATTRVAAFGYGNGTVVGNRFDGNNGWDRPVTCLEFSPLLTLCITTLSDRRQLLQAAVVVNRALNARAAGGSPNAGWLDLLLWSCRFFATLRTLRGSAQLTTTGGSDVAPRLAAVTHEAMGALAAAVHALPDEALRTVDIRSVTMATMCMSEVSAERRRGRAGGTGAPTGAPATACEDADAVATAPTRAPSFLSQ